MHEAFTMNTARLWLRMPGDMDRRPLDGYFTALGFGDDDDLWPKGSSF
jgi:type VI secretion system protein ImpG